MKLLSALAILVIAARALAASDPTTSEPLQLKGIPFYQIYEEKDIENSSRSNFITTAPDGRLFFGCENGIHTFDGTKWKQVLQTPTTPDKIRAMIWTEYGVFAAGYGTIGRLNFESDSGIRYQAINDKPLTHFASEFYSKIHRQGDFLHFIGERSVAQLNLKTLAFGATSFDSWVKGSAMYKEKLIVATARNGVVAFKGWNFTPLPEFEKFADKHVILKIECGESGETYFATESNQLYRIPADAALDDYIRVPFHAEGAIRDLEFIDEDVLAISVAHKGIHFINRKGHLLSTLSEDFDYRWVSSNSLHLDQNKTLWVQFNSTVGKVLADSPLSQIDERLSMGVDYPIAHQAAGQTYLRTNGRLLEPDFSEHGSLQGFVDSAPEIDRSIIAASATEDGIYLQGGRFTYYHSDAETIELGETGIIERMTPFANDPHTLIAATPDTLLILQRHEEEMKILDAIEHRAGHINKIARDSQNAFWLEIGIGQIGRATFEEGEIKCQSFDQADDLPADWVALWEHKGEVLFTSSSGVMRYNPSSQTFETTDIIEEHLPASGILHRVATDPHGNIWASYNNFNYILWEQPDGSYIKDTKSLSHVGDKFFNQFKFLNNGDALLLAANELYHVNGSRLKLPAGEPKRNLFLFEVSNIEGSSTYYLNSGLEATPQNLDFEYDQRSLSIRVGATHSSTVKAPQYQYFLEGISEDWSKWSTSNEVHFTKLDAGSYTLRVRSKAHDSSAPEEIAITLSIAPTLFETPLAFVLYLVIFATLLNLGYSYFAKNLKSKNSKLEKMVGERTKEIESKNSELQLNANELTKTLEELRSAQDLLMGASRKAGMAEVATNVLHNVGNVLNSINVSLLAVSERLSWERANKLVRVSKMISAHQNDLANFLTKDPKGKTIPAYLYQLSSVLSDDQCHYQVEVECMQENIEHVKKIIATQQTHAKTIEVLQPVKLETLINDALEMTTAELELSLFEITRDFEPDLEIESDKHSLLQMLTNFIKNSKESIIESRKSLGLISISARTSHDKKSICIQISDNGVGISSEDARKIFSHGFTTKPEGHGFGMHSCANAAKKLGGSLDISSEGLGKGATVTLTLPCDPKSGAKPRAVDSFPETSFSRN